MLPGVGNELASIMAISNRHQTISNGSNEKSTGPANCRRVAAVASIAAGQQQQQSRPSLRLFCMHAANVIGCLTAILAARYRSRTKWPTRRDAQQHQQAAAATVAVQTNQQTAATVAAAAAAKRMRIIAAFHFAQVND